MILILLVVVVLLLIVATISGASIAVLLTIAFGLIILIIYARLFSNLLFITTDAIYMGFTERDCPYCKEKVKNTAIKCKHCGSKLSRPKNATKQDTDKSYSSDLANYCEIVLSGEVEEVKHFSTRVV